MPLPSPPSTVVGNGDDRGWTVATWSAVAVRVVAAALLVFGPWTDDPNELEGWDVHRFQQIADTPGDPYIEHEVEYPPLTVVVAETVLADDVVTSHRRLVVLSLFVDLTLAATLARWWTPSVASVYLLLGLPMVPSGLLRLDLWAALAAVIAAVALTRHREPSGSRGQERAESARTPPTMTDLAFAAATVVGAMIKVWPVFMVAAALGVGRIRAALTAVTVGAVAGLVWIVVSGPSVIEQITSLRGVTGWHVESIPGTLTSLTTGEGPRLEADAFRIGHLNDTVVAAGRLVTIAVAGAAVLLARRSTRNGPDVVALVMLGATTALIVTAPLLSPQFLLWLTPWAAMLRCDRLVVSITAGAIVITAGTLALFGPPDLDHPVAASLLLTRNVLLAALVVVTLGRLASEPSFAYRPTTGG